VSLAQTENNGNDGNNSYQHSKSYSIATSHVHNGVIIILKIVKIITLSFDINLIIVINVYYDSRFNENQKAIVSIMYHGIVAILCEFFYLGRKQQ